jgi:transcription initiation factor IIE alpha subunit
LIYLTSGNAEMSIRAVQCERCGAIVGVLDELSSKLESIDERLKALERKLGDGEERSHPNKNV